MAKKAERAWIFPLATALVSLSCGIKGELRAVSSSADGLPAQVESGNSERRRGGLGSSPAPREDKGAWKGTGEGESSSAESLFIAAVGEQGSCHHLSALAGFRAFLQRFPQAPAAPEALLRSGELLLLPECPCHDEVKGEAVLREVLARWPESRAAALAASMLRQRRTREVDKGEME